MFPFSSISRRGLIENHKTGSDIDSAYIACRVDGMSGTCGAAFTYARRSEFSNVHA